MKPEEKQIQSRLEEIKREITALGHQYIKPKLPMDVSKVVEQMTPWGEAEAAIQKVIDNIKDLPF